MCISKIPSISSHGQFLTPLYDKNHLNHEDTNTYEHSQTTMASRLVQQTTQEKNAQVRTQIHITIAPTNA
jgi:hypothetical protein